jgi:hypothetical protein
LHIALLARGYQLVNTGANLVHEHHLHTLYHVLSSDAVSCQLPYAPIDKAMDFLSHEM